MTVQMTYLEESYDASDQFLPTITPYGFTTPPLTDGFRTPSDQIVGATFPLHEVFRRLFRD